MGVDPASLLGGEVSGGGGDVAGLVGRHVPGCGCCPNQPETMPQIQGVADQSAGCPVGDAQHTAQFGGGEAGDGRSALPAQPDRAFDAGQPAFGDGVAGM